MDEVIMPFDELKELSGYKTSKSIVCWLKTNGIPHLLNRRGAPIVSRIVLRQVLGENFKGAPSEKPTRSLDYDVIDKIGRRA